MAQTEQGAKRRTYAADNPRSEPWRAAVLRVMTSALRTQGLTRAEAEARNAEGWVVAQAGGAHVVRLHPAVFAQTWAAAVDAAALPAEGPGDVTAETGVEEHMAEPSTTEASMARPTRAERLGDLRAANRRAEDSDLARPALTGAQAARTLERFPHHTTDVRAGDINTRPGYQRLLSDRWAAEIARDFNPLIFRPILVSKRADGSLWCMDGQHRLRAFTFFLGRADDLIEADIYEGLSYGEETLLCESFVHAKPAGVLDYLRLKYERQDPDALALVEAVRAAGLDIAFERAGRGTVASAGALVAVYEASGGEHLAEVLNCLKDAFGEHARVFIQPHILGMHGFLVRYGAHENFDRREFITKISGLGLGAIQQKQAILVPTISGGNRATAFGKALQTVYNSGRRSRYLPEWVEGVLTQKQRDRREAVARVLGQKYGFTPAARPHARKQALTVVENDTV